MHNQTFQGFLTNYYLTTKGKGLLKEEKELLNLSLSKVFGYFLVQIGQTSTEDLLSESRISFKMLVDEKNKQNPAYHFIQADIDYLPFKPHTIDAILLPHSLETVTDPYHLLRQIDKMILPEGNLIISGFNPIGSKIIPLRLGEYKHNFKQANLIKASRIVDWLNLLGYDIESINYPQKHTPSLTEKTVLFLSKIGLELGNIYVISAKKRIESPTPIGLNWKLSNWLPVKKGQAVANNTNHQTTKIRETTCKK